jgi:aspartate/methionine/tyrosine aminotransferase
MWPPVRDRMTSKTQFPAGGHLFDAEDYTSWSRALHRLKPLPAEARVLFESTISEPSDLLAATIRTAFGDGPPSSFESVFGSGNQRLIRSIGARYGANPEQIVCTTGASSAILMVARAFLSNGGHVLVERPHLDLLAHLPQSLGAEVTTFERSADCASIDPDELRRAIRPDTKLIILTNPHNPSGVLLSEQALARIANVADEFGVPVLVDEVYWDFVHDTGAPIAARVAPCFISVNSLSKVYGLYSLRCGWIIAEPTTARLIENANARIEFGVSKLTHAVAVEVLDHINEFEAHWREILSVNRPVVEEQVAAMQANELIHGDLPVHGCMYFPEIVGCGDTRTLAKELWSKHGLLVAHGEFFERAGHLRIGFGDDRAGLADGLARLRLALKAGRDGQARPAPGGRQTAAQA